MKKEILEYFNSLSGKHVSSEKLKGETSTTKKIGSQLLQVLNEKTSNKSGENKTCSFFGERPVFACLKSKKVCSATKESFIKNREYQIRRLNNKLITKGANVAKLYSIFVFSDKPGSAKHLVQVLNKEDGDAIAVVNINNFSKKVVGHKIDIWGEQELQNKNLKTKAINQDRKVVGEQLFNYNFKQQQLMLSLPQEAYDKLFKTFIIFCNHRIKVSDNHAENVLVSKKGFTMVDVDYDEILLNASRKNQPDINLYIDEFLRPFSYSAYFQMLLSEEQQLTLQNNNVEILTRLINAVSRNNIVIDTNSFCFNESVFGMIGIENVFNKAEEIFKSQTDLRNSQGKGLVPFLANITKKGVKR